MLLSSALNDLVLAAIAIVPTSIGIYKLYTDGWSVLLFAVPVMVLILSARKFIQGMIKDSSEDHVHALEGALHVTHQLLMVCDNIASDPKLRITIHAVSGNCLVQVLDYVGNQRSKRTAGRHTPANCGIIGLALKNKELATGNRMSTVLQDYHDELVDKWHYTPDAAQKLDGHAMSWLAIPLINNKNTVVAILFADSVDPDFFTELRCAYASYAAAGLSDFVTHRMY